MSTSNNSTSDIDPLSRENEEVDLEDELEEAYINYAMSVIGNRALPDVRDGLKPVQRRILYALHVENIRTSYRKSSSVIGTTMGNYHPHGDKSIYDALVRMTQDFSLQAPLVDGQGNFGSMDGDPPAAMRYTESRLSDYGDMLLEDIDDNTVTFKPNYDEREQEPEVLPASFPNLLVNGSEGIAVGLSTKIPPHNPTEVINATIEYIRNDDPTVEDMLEHINGPDFPTGGTIVGTNGFEKAYKTGKGRITLRGSYEFEEAEDGTENIVINEIPYQDRTRKIELIEDIANIAKEEDLNGIQELRDESDDSVRIVVELKESAIPEIVANKIVSSVLEKTYGMIMIALVDGQPKRLQLDEIIGEYVSHRQDVVRRRCEQELEEREERAHILEGRLKALENVEEIVDLIQDADERSVAKDDLMNTFDLSQEQADHIVRMQLGSLTSMESEEIEEEYSDITSRIERLDEILGSQEELNDLIIEELHDAREEFGRERKTNVVADTDSMSLDQKDFIPEEDQILVQTETGYFKRLSEDEITSYSRNSKGLSSIRLRDEDSLQKVYTVNTHDDVYFVTTKGKIYVKAAHKLPEMSRQSRGQPAVNFLDLDDDESITTVYTGTLPDGDLVFTTKNGFVKRTNAENYDNIYSSGLLGISLEEGDEVVSVIEVDESDTNADMLLATKNGNAIRFDLCGVEPRGRRTKGVHGIELANDDEVVGADVITDDSDVVITITENGFGKATLADKYKQQGRYGKGTKNIDGLDRNGSVVDSIVLSEREFEDSHLLAGVGTGRILRTPTKEFSTVGRYTKGYSIMNTDGETITCVGNGIFQNDD